MPRRAARRAINQRTANIRALRRGSLCVEKGLDLICRTRKNSGRRILTPFSTIRLRAGARNAIWWKGLHNGDQRVAASIQ